MTRDQALAILADFMAPLSLDQFFRAFGREVVTSCGGSGQHRARIFGPRPKETVLNAFGSHSANLEHHSPAPNAPPPPLQEAESDADFLSLIRAYHQRGYTVRVPDVVPLSPPLQQISRAIECLLHQPASGALFWSYAGAKAQVHYDHRDNLVVQLEGRKRWFISTETPGLYNDWMQLGAPPTELRDHFIIDVEPGDIIYVPRGTSHSVESTTESLHVALLFNPVTVREMLIAAIDHLSDSDRSFRETAISPSDMNGVAALVAKLQSSSAKLTSCCGSADFVRGAMDHRSARAIEALPQLPRRSTGTDVDEQTSVRHAPLAVGTIRMIPNSLGFSQPGGEFAIHPGVEQEMRFIAATPEFSVGDIPGASGPEVRKALVQRLVQTGFLEVDDRQRRAG